MLCSRSRPGRFQKFCVTLIPELLHTLPPAQAAFRLSTGLIMDAFFISFGILKNSVTLKYGLSFDY